MPTCARTASPRTSRQIARAQDSNGLAARPSAARTTSRAFARPVLGLRFRGAQQLLPRHGPVPQGGVGDAQRDVEVVRPRAADDGLDRAGDASVGLHRAEVLPEHLQRLVVGQGTVARQGDRRPVRRMLDLPTVGGRSAQVRHRARDCLRPGADVLDVAQGVGASPQPADRARFQLGIHVRAGDQALDLVPARHSSEDPDGLTRLHPGTVVDPAGCRIRLSTGQQRRQFGRRDRRTPLGLGLRRRQLPTLVSPGSAHAGGQPVGVPSPPRRATSSRAPRTRSACCRARPSRSVRRRG